jgi:hypothetical protein
MITGSAMKDVKRLFKVVSPGRTGFVWKLESELPEIVVKAYDLVQEDKARRRATTGAESDLD